MQYFGFVLAFVNPCWNVIHFCNFDLVRSCIFFEMNIYDHTFIRVIDVISFQDEEKLGKGKEMVDKLTDLITIFENPALDFSKNRADGDDILGDAYEYLMRHFASESGKSKGEFYTPGEVSRLMAKVLGVKKGLKVKQTFYDPTCGSGSLLLKVAEESDNHATIYGQEKTVVT